MTLGGFTPPKPQEQTSLLTPAVIEKIVEQIEVGTITMQVHETINEKRVKEIWPIGEVVAEEATFIATGTVRAGFPAGSITITSWNQEAVVLRLGNPRILSLEDGLVKVSHKKAWFTKGGFDFEEKVRGKARKLLWGAACQGDILTRANRSAVTNIRNALKKHVRRVEVTVTPKTSC
jgi:hypothetical protein